MRVLLLASTLLALNGCGSHVDPTMNRTGDTSSAVDYPAGPYGYKEGSVIENIQFTGKIPMAAGTNYSTLPMQKITLNDFHHDSTVKILFLVGAARWCGPCNMEAPAVKMLADKYRAQGVQLLDVVVEGINP